MSLFGFALLCHLLSFKLTAVAFVFRCGGLAFLVLETRYGLFYLALYLLVVYLYLDGTFVVLVVLVVLAFLVTRIVYVHLVLFDAFAFAFLSARL